MMQCGVPAKSAALGCAELNSCSELYSKRENAVSSNSTRFGEAKSCECGKRHTRKIFHTTAFTRQFEIARGINA
jgi:hypothetical protein